MIRTKQGRILCALILCNQFNLAATNIRVTGTIVEPYTRGDTVLFVRCTLAWDNAWHDNYNHDAAWVFLKFKPRDAAYNSRHVRLKTGGHTMSAKNPGCPDPVFKPGDDKIGLFLYPGQPFHGPVQWVLRLAFDPSSIGNFDLSNGQWRLHALEMVMVPAGGYFIGDPDEHALLAAAFFRSGENGKPEGPFSVTDEHQIIEVGDQPGNLNYQVQEPEYQGDRLGPIPAGFPKGVAEFYLMKYEITQGQYVDFLNELGSQATYFRANFAGKNYADSRGSISFNGREYIAGSPARPLNFVSWDDGCAYSDWAGLRPMTEMEFEKACRGSAMPVPHEFPWGTADKTQLARFVDHDDELKFKAGINESLQKPERRAVLGAAACGAMDLAGSLWERVVSAGHPEGRAYRGSHGDGRTDSYGYATNADWPKGNNERTGGYGYRGGGYYEHGKPEGDFNPHSPIGWRNFAAWAGGPRSIAYGFRSARSTTSVQPPATNSASPAEAAIREAIAAFSKNLVDGNYDAVAAAYTVDAKIFPPGEKILAEEINIRQFWTPAPGSKNRIVYHKVLPEEIKIEGKIAYDWGYYEGATQNEKGEQSDWRGKYVIVWKEVTPGIWKIYLDCWNRAPQ